MTEDLGKMHAVIHFPVKKMKIGAAYTAKGDLDLHFSTGRRKGNTFADIDLSIACVVGSFHHDELHNLTNN
jgi:hypothetical protein